MISAYCLFYASFAAAQTHRCRCEILLDPDYRKAIVIRPDPQRTGGKKASHNLKEQDMLLMTLSGYTDSFLQVKARYSISDKVVSTGWVAKQKRIGIYLRNYSRPCPLYDRPDSRGKVSGRVPYNGKLAAVSACSGAWLYVTVMIGGKVYQGWLAPEWQCAEPYTTCS